MDQVHETSSLDGYNNTNKSRHKTLGGGSPPLNYSNACETAPHVPKRRGRQRVRELCPVQLCPLALYIRARGQRRRPVSPVLPGAGRQTYINVKSVFDIQRSVLVLFLACLGARLLHTTRCRMCRFGTCNVNEASSRATCRVWSARRRLTVATTRMCAARPTQLRSLLY